MRSFSRLIVMGFCVLLTSCSGSSPPIPVGTTPKELIVGKWQLISQASRPVPATHKQFDEFTADGKQLSTSDGKTSTFSYKFLDDQTMQLYHEDKPTIKYNVSVTKEELTLSCPTNQILDCTYKRIR